MAARPPPAWYDANRPKKDAEIANGLALSVIQYSKLKLEIAGWWRTTIGNADVSYTGTLGKGDRQKHLDLLKAQFPVFAQTPEAWTEQAFQSLVTSLRGMVGVGSSRKKSSRKSRRPRKEQLAADDDSQGEDNGRPGPISKAEEALRKQAETLVPPPQPLSLDDRRCNDRQAEPSERLLSIRGRPTTDDAITHNPQLSAYLADSEGPTSIERLHLLLFAGEPGALSTRMFTIFDAYAIWDEKKGLHSMAALREEIESYSEESRADTDYNVYIMPRSTASAQYIKIKTDRTLSSALNDVASLTKQAKVYLTSKVLEDKRTTAPPTPQHIRPPKQHGIIEPPSMSTLTETKAPSKTTPTPSKPRYPFGIRSIPPAIGKSTTTSIAPDSSRIGANSEGLRLHRPNHGAEETPDNVDMYSELGATGEGNTNQSPSPYIGPGAAVTGTA
ncbi:hypothetical protein LTS18_006908 [Coniosporium uncinatum]|uniref:Uncharacterized protein n=1 Tax=Coniosporium uncinatum TaxID=93489 RepID=A0ACC3DYV1_9PEZI|nr:hypothetical protein LTS18_006908 [Coniosporium uncinatum]